MTLDTGIKDYISNSICEEKIGLLSKAEFEKTFPRSIAV
jgi:hypothetical protein